MNHELGSPGALMIRLPAVSVVAPFFLVNQFHNIVS